MILSYQWWQWFVAPMLAGAGWGVGQSIVQALFPRRITGTISREARP